MKSFKSFVTEYAMGLQVPATSYLKPVGSLVSGKPLRKKEEYDVQEEEHVHPRQVCRVKRINGALQRHNREQGNSSNTTTIHVGT